MPEKAKKIMPPIKYDSILPADFDGVFRFTNWTDREFIGMWNKVAYRFPPNSTSPMIISNATPEEVQHIRRKFAKELGEREFYRSDRYKELDSQARPGSGNVAAIYTDEDIAPFVQRCLEPLPEARATAHRVQGDKTENYHTDVTQVLDKDDLAAQKPLIEGAAQVAI